MDASNVIAIVGAIAAACGAGLACWQYRATKAITRLAHVNGLFRDLLRLEFDFYNAPNPDPQQRPEVEKRLHSYKMWVLEEMWIWLKEIKQQAPRRKAARAAHRGLVENWTNTLNFHIEQTDPTRWKGFAQWRACYHVGFYRHVVRHLRSTGLEIDPRVPAIASHGTTTD